MKTLACVFSYERPRVLAECAKSILTNPVLPDEVFFIDDGSTNKKVGQVFDALPSGKTEIRILKKPKHAGFSDSAAIAIQHARKLSPQYLFLIEGDYIFRPDSFEVLHDVFENTEEGRMCLGISGYDNPCFYNMDHRTDIFPRGMAAQMRVDNVNRAALYKPQRIWTGNRELWLELVSNTCFSSYLNWHRILKFAETYPELNDYLDRACCPIDDPQYPQSGKYRAMKVVDDGMLSHGINLVWNKWAIANNLDRDRFGAWLNIKPSVANHISGGGLNNGGKEMETQAGSPSW